MPDNRLSPYLQYGTTAERTAFTPNPPSAFQLIYLWWDTTLSALYVWDGSSWQAGGGGTFVIVAAADESVANDTLQDDNELVFPVEANSVYVFEMCLFFTTGTSNAVDVNSNFAIPASATLTQSILELGDSSTAGNTVNFFGSAIQEGTPTANSSGVVTTGTLPSSCVWIKGVLRTAGTAGNLQYRFAQRVSTPGTPLIRETDSFLKITKVS